jgi:hypothetical protein
VVIVRHVAQVVVHGLGNRGAVLLGEGLLRGIALVGDGSGTGVTDSGLKLSHTCSEGYRCDCRSSGPKGDLHEVLGAYGPALEEKVLEREG